MTRRIGRLVPLVLLVLGSSVWARSRRRSRRCRNRSCDMWMMVIRADRSRRRTWNSRTPTASPCISSGRFISVKRRITISLNRDFQTYDAVLYEMVKPKDAPPPGPGDGEKSDSAISQFQRFLKDALDLDFQLDDIDYTAPNFVHADLDKETFEKMQEERGETFEMIFLRMIMKAFTDPPVLNNAANEDPGDDLIAMLAHPDMERQIKLVVARQLGQIDLSAMGLDGPNGSVLVTERNKAALKVLSDTLASGKRRDRDFLRRGPHDGHEQAAGGDGFFPNFDPMERGVGSDDPAGTAIGDGKADARVA